MDGRDSGSIRFPFCERCLRYTRTLLGALLLLSESICVLGLPRGCLHKSAMHRESGTGPQQGSDLKLLVPSAPDNGPVR